MKYREEIYIENNDGEKIYGVKVPAITFINEEYCLSYIVVFRNGLIHSYWGFETLEQIKEKVKAGKIMQNVPDDVELLYEEFGYIQCSNLTPDKTNDDFIKEVEDLINLFNNRETRDSLCREAFKKYLIDSSLVNLNNLKEKYNDLPSHEKVLFEYIDVKDPLCCFMEEGTPFTLERRKELLKEYFNEERKL